MRAHRGAWAVLALVLVAVLPAPAEGAFPGANGKLAFDSDKDGDFEIYSVNPDGTGEAKLTNNTTADRNPAWSPDGTKIAFVCCTPSQEEVWVMSATGANPVKLTEGDGFVDSAAWSPDGSKIAFSRKHCPCAGGPYYMDLWTVDAGGTNETEILDAGLTLEPSWSPDGTEIAIGYHPGYGGAWIATVQPDGSDLTPVTEEFGSCFDYGADWSPDGAGLVFERDTSGVTVNRDGTGQSSPCPPPGAPAALSPVWSPDGTKIAFLDRPSPGPWEIHVSNPDFTNEQEVTETLAVGGSPRGLDWQPIPINSYIRPAGATTIQASLVPAYRSCDAGQATISHGPPLAHPSCASPALTSGYLTLGTGDANGHPANSRGHLWLTRLGETPINTSNGDQADITYDLQLTDVRKLTDLTDYAGELQARITLRLTDRDNTPSPFPTGAATVTDTTLSFNAACAPTASPNIGATCTASTTADALVPGTVKEAKRAVWELGKVRVLDGGSDGDTQTGPNTLFAVQGVFVP